MNYSCDKCGKTYEIETNLWKCSCGGLFNLSYEKKPIDFENLKNNDRRSLWRYIDALPFGETEECWKEITLGEGGTPLLRVDYKNPNLLGKADYYMPTLSFKDRGAVMLVALAKKLGAERVVADSSGNAGTAIAAYGARAGLKCDIFVPEATSEKKVKQIIAHGGIVHRIPGSREDTAASAIKAVEENIGETSTKEKIYASHIFNPFFYEGTKTYVYEVFEQMGGKLPEAFIVPVGNGTLLLGVSIALKELLKWGYIQRLPRILAVQAKNCAPIYKAFTQGTKDVSPIANLGTAAEGIAIAAPARGSQILGAIRETGGDIVEVSEEAILSAGKELAKKGIYVEVTSAVNYAGYLMYMDKYPKLKNKIVVIPLCGAGIKSN